MKHSSTLTTVLLFVIVVFLAQLWLDRGMWSVPEFQEVVVADACTPGKPRLNNGSVLQQGKEHMIGTNNLVHFLTCTAGVLRLSLRGSLFDDYGPFVVISLGSQTLWAQEVRDNIDVRIHTNTGGWIGIAFVNDAYEPPQDRNLWLSNLSFTPIAESDTGN